MKMYATLLIVMLFANCLAQTSRTPDTLSLNTPLNTDKAMVLCLSPIDEFRNSFETAMKTELQFHGIHTETSHQQLPITLNQEPTTEIKLAQLIESLPEKGFNKLIISAISEVEHTKIDAEGYFGDFDLFHFATHLYTIDDNGSFLVWSMCLCIYDYQLPLLSVQDFAYAIVSKMIEDGVLEIDDANQIKLFTL